MSEAGGSQCRQSVRAASVLLQCPKVTLHPVSPVSAATCPEVLLATRPAAAVTWQHTRYYHCTVGNGVVLT